MGNVLELIFYLVAIFFAYVAIRNIFFTEKVRAQHAAALGERNKEVHERYSEPVN
jgi:hypothetical protein